MAKEVKGGMSETVLPFLGRSGQTSDRKLTFATQGEQLWREVVLPSVLYYRRLLIKIAIVIGIL